MSGEPRHVSAFAPWDLQGTYGGWRGWQFAAGVRNLFDAAPPVSDQRDWFQIGSDPQVASPARSPFLSPRHVRLE